MVFTDLQLCSRVGDCVCDCLQWSRVPMLTWQDALGRHLGPGRMRHGLGRVGHDLWFPLILVLFACGFDSRSEKTKAMRLEIARAMQSKMAEASWAGRGIPPSIQRSINVFSVWHHWVTSARFLQNWWWGILSKLSWRGPLSFNISWRWCDYPRKRVFRSQTRFRHSNSASSEVNGMVSDVSIAD